jgi:TetR/AcrR family transcriptional regulator, transcriptional repressor for nem operon
MANSAKESPAAPGKRERLVASAARLLHERGVQGPTLAEIAEAADVPLGNVYYYFKTRDELVGAVIDSRSKQIHSLLGSLDRRSSPAARLKGLTETWLDSSEMVAAHGCPIGTLCSEIGKTAAGPSKASALIFDPLLDWSEAQFREMGHGRQARTLATTLIAGVQGAAVLSAAQGDPRLMRSQVRRLDRWIDEVAESPGARGS